MPILAAFIVGLLFKNIDARSVIISVIFGVIFYYWMLLPLAENASMETQNVKFHYIHLMAINLLAMIIVILYGFCLIKGLLSYTKKSHD